MLLDGTDAVGSGGCTDVLRLVTKPFEHFSQPALLTLHFPCHHSLSCCNDFLRVQSSGNIETAEQVGNHIKYVASKSDIQSSYQKDGWAA